MSTPAAEPTVPGIGVFAPRPDGAPKVRGDFPFCADLAVPGMLWAALVRAPHASARIDRIDVDAALKLPGVHAVVTQADVPGYGQFGPVRADQPVFADGVVRFHGEPVAAVAAEHPETARRAARAVLVDYTPIEPVQHAELAFTAKPVHPEGNVLRQITLRHGDPDARGDVVVSGTYEVGRQDPSFLAAESAVAFPLPDGGVRVFLATNCPQADRDQLAQCLDLPPERVHVLPAEIGGAYGPRSDVAVALPACLLALRTSRPVKVVLSRAESFAAHGQRHAARMVYRHHASRDGVLVKVEAELLLDGGAYTTTSGEVLARACAFAAGPYRVPNVKVDGHVMRTNKPPAGSMRGGGAVQVCFAHEAQMDKLAAELGMDPVELRLRNLIQTGDTLPTGQILASTAPIADLIQACAMAPLPEPVYGTDLLNRPGGTGRTAETVRLRRGVGLAIGYIGLGPIEGVGGAAEVRLELADGVVTVLTGAAESGQGVVTVAQQVVREVLGIAGVLVETVGTEEELSVPRSSGLTWAVVGAVEQAARSLRTQALAPVASQYGMTPELLSVRDGRVVSYDGLVDQPAESAFVGLRLAATARYELPATDALDNAGQGNICPSYGFAAQRAVVDLDPELGLVKVSQVTAAQDVGRVLNPTQLVGQIEGAIGQGVGLAISEDLRFEQGVPQNGDFRDYLVPTAADLPDVQIAALIEYAEPGTPFGMKPGGTVPIVPTPAAIAAALRAASGHDVPRLPVRPGDLLD